MDNEMMNNDLEFNLPPNRSSVIKVLGIGGGGSNAVNHMTSMGIKDVDFMICNTDAQALEFSKVENKVQLGVSLTEGLGAGANPEVGRNAAIESKEQLRKELESNTKMLFITAGMGGGTGTGAAPIIAELAQEMKLLTVGVVTMPFTFEGKARMKQAEEGLEELRKHVDSLIIIKNDKLREVYGNLGFKAGFSKADVILATAVKAIAEVITHHYRANIDLEDARRVLANSGTAIMGSATSMGENRAQKAIKDALDSPLLNDNHIKGAKNVLLLIVSGDDEHEITFDEIGEINEHIQHEAGGNTNIILGIGEDSSLGNKISVTVIATGFERIENMVDPIQSIKPTKKMIPLEEEPATTEAQPQDNTIVEETAAPTNSPLEEPLEKVQKEEKLASPQTDLFAEVSETKESIIREQPTINELPNVDPLNSPAPELEEEEEEMLQTFVLEEETEEITEEEPASESVDFTESSNFTEIQHEPVQPTSHTEIQESIPVLDTLIEEQAEESFSFEMEEESAEETIVKENNESNDLHFEIEAEEEDEPFFEVTNQDHFEITNEEPEVPTAVDEPIVQAETKMNPLDFSISEVQGSTPENEVNPIDSPIQTSDEAQEVNEPAQKVQHDLQDLLDLEETLGLKSSSQTTTNEPKQEETKDEFQVSIREVEEETEETDPVEDHIASTMKQRIAERKNRLKAFTYNFKRQQEELNKPAYQRAGIDIQNDGLSTDQSISGMSVNGEGKNIGFGGNSFLHDNVD